MRFLAMFALVASVSALNIEAFNREEPAAPDAKNAKTKDVPVSAEADEASAEEAKAGAKEKGEAKTECPEKKEGDAKESKEEGEPCAAKGSPFAHCAYEVPKTGGACALVPGQGECMRARKDTNFLFTITDKDGTKVCTW